MLGIAAGGIVKFGQCDGISGGAEDNVIHKRPHEQDSAAMCGFNVLIQCGIGQAGWIESGAFILHHDIRAAGRYTIFDADMFITITAVAVLDGIGKCFIDGKFKGKKVTVGKCVSLTLR